MKLLNNKLLLTAVEEKTMWEGVKDESIKLGKLAFPFKGKVEDDELNLKKGDELYYQYGTNIKLDGEEYVLVSASNLICLK